jgi:hypothetical protein
VGGFVFGLIVTSLLLRAGRVEPRDETERAVFKPRPVW